MRFTTILKILGAVILFLFVLTQLSEPFQGSSNFCITTTYYLLAICCLLYIAYCFKKPVYGFVIMGVSVFVSLYFCEVYLRYYLKNPVTYSEIQWGTYQTMYDCPNNKISTIDPSESPKTLHTNVMTANSSRDYTSPEYTYSGEYTNDLGLRGPLPKANKKVICALGDSFTESMGAPADSTYPLLLENTINIYDSNIAVLNAGVSGNDPFFEFMLLKELAVHNQITDAIFLVNLTDVDDVMSRGGKERFLPNGSLQFRSGPWWEPIYAISHIFRLVLHKVWDYDYNLMTKDQIVLAEQNAINAITNLFSTDVIPWSINNKIRIFIVLQPMLSSVNDLDSRYVEMRKQLSSLKNITFLDIQPRLKNTPSIQDYYWPMDGHFNSSGYKLMAECIAEKVLKTIKTDSINSSITSRY
jgi:lysophospholipase L1-like esterase